MYFHPLKKQAHSGKNDRGQLSIFFGVTLVILITVMAFIINVGLFVKAKINLQNAVDAAAWSGAAVQARQLSNIAYLNWEMRNIYKEWMFKYYVLGQLSNPPQAHGSMEDFRITKNLKSAGILNSLSCNDNDCFNIPSICIHFSEEARKTTNICEIFKVPGLPRFESPGLPGVDNPLNSAINSFVEQKSKDCSKRSMLNFYTTALWAYGSGFSAGMFKEAPQIASDRPGAYLQAMEVAMRIRNVEKMVNLTPQGEIDINRAKSYDAAKGIPLYERPVKAFWAAYRNLENNDSYSMKQSFVLTELAPNANSMNTVNLSTLLIPMGKEEIKKPYLDLKLNLINFATFYTAFVPDTNAKENSTAEGSLGDQARCGITKIAMPVPAYPIGFDKNPNVMTYYAVKGSAKFVGLFNPFNRNRPAVLTAYAAAKPFGGRIGPKLFKHTTTNDMITVRGDTKRSYHYLSALNHSGHAYGPGIPIPASSTFWAQSQGDIVGGSSQGQTPLFVVPNLLYDLGDTNVLGAEYIQKISPPLGGATKEDGGLYSVSQYTNFQQNLLNATGVNAFSPANIASSLNKARAPTKYEYLNYMIPSRDEDFAASKDPKPSSVGTGPITEKKATPDDPDEIPILAPLYAPSPFSWYENDSDIIRTFNEYLDKNESAINAYSQAIFDVAKSIRDDGAAHSIKEYDQAADTFHDNPADPFNATCKTIAGKFSAFYKSKDKDRGDPACTPLLSDLFKDYLAKRAESGEGLVYNIKFVKSDINLFDSMTAYFPGINQGATDNQHGNVLHPFLSGNSTLNKRNYYSTKFIPLNSLLNKDTSYIGGSGSFTMYSEGQTGDAIVSEVEGGVPALENALSDDGGVISSIKH